MSFRRRTVPVLVVLVAAAMVLPLGAAAASPMPPPPAGAVPEPLPEYQAQDECSATAKPGVVAFKQLLLARYPGSRNLGIVRACHLGARSEHKEGRAFDWGVRVDRAKEAAYARDLTSWLLATDADGVRYANARRLGIMYMIWNRRIWSSTRAAEGWRTYTGPNPHSDHVHFSFTWPAAYKLTSYWTGKSYGSGSAGGALDRSFGSNGWTALSRSRSVRLVAQLQRDDDRLLSVGQTHSGTELILAGVSPLGDPQSAYGGDSRVRLPLPEGAVLEAATMLSNGAIIVAGSVPAASPDPAAPAERDALLIRVTTRGVLDTRFGSAGTAVIDFGGDDRATAVTSAEDGTLLVTGVAVEDGVAGIGVARTLPNGSLDLTFGTGGVVRPTARGAVAGTTILALPDGRSLIGCHTVTNKACLLRLTSSGLPDPGFGVDGTVLHQLLRTVAVVVAAPGGKLLVAGHDATGTAAGVLRLKGSGSRDSSFGVDGATSLRVAGCVPHPTGLVVRWDGSPVVSARLTDCASGGFVGRLLPDGSLDARWGKNGVALIGGPGTAPGALLQQSDGRIVLPATLGVAPDTDMTGVRFTIVGPVPGRLGVSRSAAITTYGTAVTIIGSARSTADNNGVAGVPVTFFKRRYGATAWTKIGTTTTDSSGRARLRHTPVAATSYRTRSATTDRLYAAQSATTRIQVRPRLTAPATPAVVRRGTPVLLSVTVQPTNPGRTIALQRLVNGRWTTLTTRTLTQTGAARVRVVHTKAVIRSYRWLLAADADHLKGWSRTMKIEWR